MTTQLQISDDLSRQMIEVESTQKMCQSLLKTPHYAKIGTEGIFAIISKARSLGMDLIEALNGGLYYVQGRVGMPAESMAALIRQKGHSITKDAKSNNDVCVLHGRRADNGDTWVISFSMDDARKAGLAKNMYEKYPSTMLYNRAMSFLARQLFPDIIRGAGYTYDELREIASSNNTVTVLPSSEEMKVDTISEKQAFELSAIFKECESAYQEKVFVHLKKADPSIDCINQIPVNLFDRIKAAAIKKSEEYRDKMTIKADITSDYEAASGG